MGETSRSRRVLMIVGVVIACAAILLPVLEVNASSTTVEAEDMTGTTPVSDSAASGGQAGDVSDRASFSAGVPAGHYRLEARMRQSARASIEVDGNRVADNGPSAGFIGRPSVVYVAGPSSEIAVVPAQGTTVRLDWVSLEPVEAQFTTSGNRILGLDGQPMTPRGTNSSSTGGWPYPNSARHLPEDFDVMADWHVNIVRIHVNHQFWLYYGVGQNCRYNAGYKDVIDAEVQRATSRGMIALVDLHYISADLACDPAGPGTLRKMADQRSLDFWTQAASRYKDNPLVWFDLYNEPNNISDEIWRDGGYPRKEIYEAAGMQELYEAVRATGATNPVIVSGQAWAANPNVMLTHPLDGYGIISGVHYYGKEDTSEGTIANRPHDFTAASEAFVEQWIPPVAAVFPVVITEFGTPYSQPYDNPQGYNAQFLEWLEGKGYGWIVHDWVWVDSNATNLDYYGILKQPPPGEVASEPNPAGVSVRDALATHNAGLPTTTTTTTTSTTEPPSTTTTTGLFCPLFC